MADNATPPEITEDEIDSDGFKALLKVANEVCAAASKRISIKIMLDTRLLAEVHLSALISRGFHGKDTKPNHIKQAAHVAFWFIKLRPARSAVPAFQMLIRRSGATALLQRMDPNYLERRVGAEDYLINEYVASAIALRLVRAGYNDIRRSFQNAGDSDRIKDLDEQLSYLIKRYTDMGDTLATSYREHNYSARGLATMLEVAFRTGHE